VVTGSGFWYRGFLDFFGNQRRQQLTWQKHHRRFLQSGQDRGEEDRLATSRETVMTTIMW